MYSIKFPDMISNITTKICSDHEATVQNLKLTLLSEKDTLGYMIKRMKERGN